MANKELKKEKTPKKRKSDTAGVTGNEEKKEKTLKKQKSDAVVVSGNEDKKDKKSKKQKKEKKEKKDETPDAEASASKASGEEVTVLPDGTDAPESAEAKAARLESGRRKVEKQEKKRKRKEKAIEEAEEKKRKIDAGEAVSDDESSDAPVLNPALAYLDTWATNRASWKFQKVRQTWILQNLYNPAKVPVDYFNDRVMPYLEGLGGGAKDSTLKKAREIVEGESDPEDESEDEEDDKDGEKEEKGSGDEAEGDGDEGGLTKAEKRKIQAMRQIRAGKVLRTLS